jgi:hypothetical protein
MMMDGINYFREVINTINNNAETLSLAKQGWSRNKQINLNVRAYIKPNQQQS